MSGPDPDTTDELAASLGLRYPSPARARPNGAFRSRDRLSTPLAQRSPNITRRKQLNLDVTPSLLRDASPSKSMFFDPDPEEGGAESPWRIKVTVQAEPRDGSSPMKSPAPRSRVIRVPLKDADSSPAKAKPGKKRNSDAGSVIKKRKGTPMRRRSGRVSGGRKSEEMPTQDTPVPEQQQPQKRPRGRPRKSAPPEELDLTDVQHPEPTPEVEQIQTHEQSPELGEDQEDEVVQEEAEQMDGAADDDFVHIDTYVESTHSDDGAAHSDYEPSDQEDKEAEERPNLLPTGVNQPFDFTSLTPLHVKHPLPPPQKQQTPPQPDPRGLYVATELYTDIWRNRFSPLPARISPRKSPLPFSKRHSSPASEQDADMWRSMVPTKRRASSQQAAVPVEPAFTTADEYDFDADLEEDMPEATSRTVGDATMMQSEDFSMVSLSSLPSARDINSSMLGPNVDQHQKERPAVSSTRPSKLQKAVTFSSPLSQSFHSQKVDEVDQENKGTSNSDSRKPLPQHRTPQKSSLRSPSQHRLPQPYAFSPLADIESLRTPELPRPRLANVRVSYPHAPQRTPVITPARLPTPNSAENQSTSPPQHNDLQSDVSYPEVLEAPVVDVQNTPAKSEAEMSTPPATPLPEESPSAEERREASVMSSGSRKSWADEPKSARMAALERKWQEERENVRRTLAEAKGQVIEVESDQDSSEEEPEADEDAESIQADVPQQEATADIWQDISASYEEGPSHLPKRKLAPSLAAPAEQDRPSKIARTEQRRSPHSPDSVEEKPVTTPRKSFHNEENVGSVQRRAKTKSDISAIFERLGDDDVLNEALKPQTNVAPARPSPLRQAYRESRVDETDISALSDVRQLRNEIKQARRQPPYPLTARSHTISIPTKTKSIDDTLTTRDDAEEDEEEEEEDYSHVVFDETDAGEHPSVVSFTGQRRPSKSLFSNEPKETVAVIKTETHPVEVSRIAKHHTPATPNSAGIFTYIWNTLTFSHPYIPPPRPNHEILFGNPEVFPLLPRVWPWSHTHWQTLDDLYTYYKRKPSRFSPSRTARPDNRGLMTAAWKKFIGITIEHWGYRVRLDDTHIVLAILYTRLLVLPSAKEYRQVYGKDLVSTCDQCVARKGLISGWDVLIKLFALVAGELLREDEAQGRRVRRDLEDFKYRLAGEAVWRDVMF